MTHRWTQERSDTFDAPPPPFTESAIATRATVLRGGTESRQSGARTVDRDAVLGLDRVMVVAGRTSALLFKRTPTCHSAAIAAGSGNKNPKLLMSCVLDLYPEI
jgi:hypothetical protein